MKHVLLIVAACVGCGVPASPASPTNTSPTAAAATAFSQEPVRAGANQASPRQNPFVIQYSDGVPAAARAAFDYAAARWAPYLQTPVEIRVRVTWIDRGPTGFALPNAIRNFAQAPRPDVYYPSALADAIAGRDLQPGVDDMNIFLKEGNWYFGTDGATNGASDMVTVAMHEIGHGIGISTTAFIPWEGEKVASFGLPNEFVTYFDLSFPLPTLDGTPSIFDAMLVDENGRLLTNSSIFPNPSNELYEAFQRPIYFIGEAARRAAASTGGSAELVRIDSQSAAHLHKPDYPTDDPDHLMAPALGTDVVLHSPGPITLAILRDLGWPGSKPQ